MNGIRDFQEIRSALACVDKNFFLLLRVIQEISMSYTKCKFLRLLFIKVMPSVGLGFALLRR